MNLRPFDPQSNALPGCATSRSLFLITTCVMSAICSHLTLAWIQSMVRQPKTWSRKHTKTCFVCLDGKLLHPGTDKGNAKREFHRLMPPQEVIFDLSVPVILVNFPDWVKEVGPKSFHWVTSGRRIRTDESVRFRNNDDARFPVVNQPVGIARGSHPCQTRIDPAVAVHSADGDRPA